MSDLRRHGILGGASPTRIRRSEVLGSHIPETKWEPATVTTLDERIPKSIQKIAKRDPFSGKVVTGGIVTTKDSAWLLSWTVNRQPHFKPQPKDQIVAWVYAVFVEKPGDYLKKPMEAVYTLLDVERGVPEVFNSTYDIRILLSATGRLRDGK